jgi:hypothetical protein
LLKTVIATVLLLGSMTFTQSRTAPTLDQNNTWTGTNSFKYVNNIRYAEQFSGADIGVKISAAFADCSGAMCTVIVPPGSFTYATTIVVPAPATLECKQGAILNYTGTAEAVKLGPDGLTISTYSPNPYHVQGCTFTGGASATRGVYVNQFVTKVFIESNYFHNFGNPAAYNIWLQGENWDARINDNYMWVDDGRTAFNGIGQGANDPANGSRGDFGQSQGYILNNHVQSSLVGISANGIHLTIGDNTITGAPAIRLGGYSHSDVVRGNTMEAAFRSAFPCIQYGDPAGDRAGTVLQGVVVEHNLCNAHNDSFGNTSHFIGPTTGSASIRVWSVYSNRVADLHSAEPLIVMNDLKGQTGNYAFGNTVSNNNTVSYKTVPSGRLHTAGRNIDLWVGPDELLFATNGLHVNGPYSGQTVADFENMADARGSIILKSGLTTTQYGVFQFQDYSGALMGDLECSGAGLGNVCSLIGPGAGHNEGLSIDASGNVSLGNNRLANVDTTGKGTFIGGIQVGAAGSTVADSRNLAQFSATLTTTAATSDNVPITGVTASSKCSLTPTNASAATNVATTYISAKAANQISVAHLATASMTYDILCSAQ